MSNRVKGRGCRLCNNERQTSFPEQAIFYYLKQIFEDTSNRTVLKEVKNKLLFKSGISLIRIRDHKLLENEHNNTLIVYHNYETPSSIRDTLLELRDVLLANINLSKKQNEDLQRWESISLETDTPAILASFKDNIKTRSVASFDWLMKEWHPILNERLSPEVIHRGSGKNVWWLCEDGHNFLMTPNKRTTPANKRNCPFL